MLLEDDLSALLVSLSDRVDAPDLVAGARRRFRRRRLARAGVAVSVVAVLATGTTVTLAQVQGSTAPATLRTAASPTPPPPVAAGDDYASVEQGTHDLILISADTGVHTVLHHTAPGDPVPATAVVSPSRRYVYYLTMDGDFASTAWRISLDGGQPQRLPSSAHAGPGGAGGLGISPNDLVVSPDDSEYAYPAFDHPSAAYVQQVSGGAALLIGDEGVGDSSETLLGWLDDDRLVKIYGGITTSAGLVLSVERVSRTGLDSTATVVDAHPGDALSGVGAQLAGGQIVVDDPISTGLTRHSRLRLLSVQPGLARTTTWTPPPALMGFNVVDITPLPDGRALVRYDNNHCGAKPLPTVIYSPDGSSEPAYGAPASALHC